MTEEKIVDNPTSKHLKESIEQMRVFRSLFHCIRPVLKALKVDTSEVDKALKPLDNLAEDILEEVCLPDQFNDIFSERGWIAYDTMDSNLTREVIDIAETQGVDQAEEILVSHYTAEKINTKLKIWFYWIDAFALRQPLILLALEDYQAERYHACIPALLAQIDGLVNDLHENQKGFFSAELDMTAWDSVAAHSTGLGVLHRLTTKSRNKTVTDEISIPYRNGILHGRDLGYANKVVAAKTWALLFAVLDWAKKMVKGEKDAPLEQPQPSWRQTTQRFSHNRLEAELIKNLRPRQIKVGKDIPSYGDLADYDLGSPEQKLVEFLGYWNEKNYGYMAKCLPLEDRSEFKGALPRRVKEHFGNRSLIHYELLEVRDSASAVTYINVRLTYDNGIAEDKEFKLINKYENGEAATFGAVGSEWSIFAWEWI